MKTSRQLNQRPSIGCEVNPNILQGLAKLKENELIQHVQLTIPTAIGLKSINRVLTNSGLDLVIHSNLLNTFGEQDWGSLKIIAKKIKNLHPIHVVEHFTAFRPTRNSKAGVYFSPNLTEARQAKKIQENIERWQEILDLPLCFENIPITNHVSSYFDFFLTLTKKTGAQVVCDVPHFLLSCISAEMKDEEITALAQRLDPVQIHVADLIVRNGRIQDSHKNIQKWMVAAGRALFPNSPLLTIEQNSSFSHSTLERKLKTLTLDREFKISNDLRNAASMPMDAINSELGQHALSFLNKLPFCQFSDESATVSPRIQMDAITALDLFESYQPFVYPFRTIELATRLDNVSLLKSVATACYHAISVGSWWTENESNNRLMISCENKEGNRISKIIGSNDGTLDPLTAKRFVFRNCTGFWVEVAAPILVSATNA